MTQDTRAGRAKDLLALLRGQGGVPFLEQLSLLAGELSPSDIGNIGYALREAYETGTLKASDFSATLRVTVLSNGNVAEICNQLRATLAACRVKADIRDTGFNQWRFELMKGADTREGPGPHLVLCLLDEHVIFEETGFSADLDTLAEKLGREGREIEGLVEKFCATSRTSLVLNTILLSRVRLDVFIDFSSRAKLSKLWHRFNERILSIPEKFDRVCALDSAVLLQGDIPSWVFTEARLSAVAKMHLSSAAMLGYAKEYAKIARAMLGQSKKCLVMDLDNTLWGGVLGDDGADALEVETGDYGNAFQQFQEVVAALGRQGVILAVNSKNDLANVRECFGKRSMPLREELFARIQANWRSKDENMREIASALNIGMDSMVFMDDSAFECDWIRRSLPEVAVVHLDGAPPEFPAMLLREGMFNRMHVTEEDRMRNALYATERQRNKSRSSFDSIEAYLGDLCLKISLSQARPEHVHRVAQLTQRTNQFNLTALRLSDAGVLDMLQQPQRRIFVFEVEDRFGSYGTVGAVFAHVEAGEFRIDNFVMSCRVFSRGIEQAILHKMCELAGSAGCATISGRYVRTEKNKMFADFYSGNGFLKLDSCCGEECFAGNTSSPPHMPRWISLESGA